MLYTFSQSQYPESELQGYFAHIQSNDVVVLWGNAVLLPIKYSQLFQQIKFPCYAMEADLNARGIATLISQENIKRISMEEFVKLTEKYTPQLGM